MATKLNKQLKREIEVDGKPYMVTLSPEGVKLTEKGKRLGKEVTWKELVGGDVAPSGAPALPVAGGDLRLGAAGMSRGEPARTPRPGARAPERGGTARGATCARSSAR